MKHKNTSIVILAAGKGTRMKSVLPKLLHKICGREMILLVMECARAVSDDVHVILGHGRDEILQKICEFYENIAGKICENFGENEKILMENPKKNLKITAHFQDLEHFPGTAGAFMNVTKSNNIFLHLRENVMIMNGDMPLVTPNDLQNFSENSFEIGVFSLDNPANYGRVEISYDQILKIIEDKDCDKNEREIKTVNAGVYSLPRDLLQEMLQKVTDDNAQHEFYLTDIVKISWEMQNSDKKIAIKPIYVTKSNFLGVNSRADLSVAEDILRAKINEKLMENGVTMHNPATIYVDLDSKITGECEFFENVRVENSEISGSTLLSHTIVTKSNIKNSVLGPFAHIRPNCEIFDSKIGNFVEVKASKIIGAKANHLSYLGDCEVANGVNIGAGVITCNYDGIKKSKTYIGENTFIGSDVQLIAPVKIEKNVLIAAGSTISRDCLEGVLAISRSEQKNIKNGYQKFFKKERKS